MFHHRFLILFIFFILWLTATPGFALSKNGFELDNSLIDPQLILHGGPPKDGIPALHYPQFVKNNNADFLAENDRVLGVIFDGQAKAYPIKILNWHEVVNDRIAPHEFIVSYCPLCGTGMVFSSRVDNNILKFGVSGLLYNSDVLLYDQQTGSLWSQILGKSISGEYAGYQLDQLPVVHTSWRQWLDRYPETLVLSLNTGFSRDYSHNPYGNYATTSKLYFPVEQSSDTFHPKETVLGVSIGDQHKAYPFSLLQKFGKTSFKDKIGKTDLTIHWDKDGFSAVAVDVEGRALQQIQGFWFAWYGFHPDTEVFSLP